MGSRWGVRRGREFRNCSSAFSGEGGEESENGMAGKGTRRSSVIVMGRERREGVERKSVKAEWSSGETRLLVRWV